MKLFILLLCFLPCRIVWHDVEPDVPEVQLRCVFFIW